MYSSKYNSIRFKLHGSLYKITTILYIDDYYVVESKDHLKMDDLWNGLKSYSDKQIKPLSQHVNRLKVRHILQYMYNCVK